MNKCLSFVPRSTPPSLAVSLSLPLFLHNRFRATAHRRTQLPVPFGYRLRGGREKEREGARRREGDGGKRLLRGFNYTNYCHTAIAAERENERKDGRGRGRTRQDWPASMPQVIHLPLCLPRKTEIICSFLWKILP